MRSEPRRPRGVMGFESTDSCWIRFHQKFASQVCCLEAWWNNTLRPIREQDFKRKVSEKMAGEAKVRGRRRRGVLLAVHEVIGLPTRWYLDFCDGHLPHYPDNRETGYSNVRGLPDPWKVIGLLHIFLRANSGSREADSTEPKERRKSSWGKAWRGGTR